MHKTELFMYLMKSVLLSGIFVGYYALVFSNTRLTNKEGCFGHLAWAVYLCLLLFDILTAMVMLCLGQVKRTDYLPFIPLSMLRNTRHPFCFVC